MTMSTFKIMRMRGRMEAILDGAIRLAKNKGKHDCHAYIGMPASEYSEQELLEVVSHIPFPEDKFPDVHLYVEKNYNDVAKISIYWGN